VVGNRAMALQYMGGLVVSGWWFVVGSW